MAAICPTIVEGDRIRITEVDGCGRPVYGACKSVITDGLVSIKLTPEVEAAEEKNVKNFAGRQCLSRAGCDTTKWWTVEIVWCNVNFAAFRFINPTYEMLTDDDGNVIGFYASNSVDCRKGYAVEIWAQVDGASDACTGEEAEGQWAYIPVPWVAGGTPGEISIGGEDSVTFTTTGKTRNGHRWGVGPYDVMLKDGQPAPLPKPMDGDKPYGFVVTTFPPPEMDCDCQEVPRPIPTPADLSIDADPTDGTRNTIRLRADNHGLGPVMVTWEEGATPVEVADMQRVSHKYTTTGTKTITVCDKQTPTICKTVDITIPLPDDKPTLTITKPAGSDIPPLMVTAQVTAPPQVKGVPILIDWGDGQKQTVTANEDGTYASVTHLYKYPRTYRVRAYRTDNETYYAEQTITVPLAEAPAPAAPTAINTTGPTATSITVNWTWSQGSGAPATGFEVRYRTPAGSGTWSAVKTATATDRKLDVTGLTASTEYEFEVVAVNGSSKSTPATGTGTTSATALAADTSK
ncbi:fibronectin type III domain-containing protein [Streptomyces sp. NPDC046374]|uniref:fibronectin type III domain-containing protein n=1 Tax=Streptomyces sp. NPDC046374 TaxID=3154917 RepID=UPI0034075214